MLTFIHILWMVLYSSLMTCQNYFLINLIILFFYSYVGEVLDCGIW